MILKSFVGLFALYNLGAECADYTFDSLAGGWMKLHQPASWTDASSRCDSEGAVLASPVISQIRNAIREYVTRQGKPGATVLTGTHANFAKGDYYSVEDVPLTKMPVLVESGASVDYQSEESCVKWSTSKDEVAVMKCSEKSPFVCFKKRNSLVVAGCGTRDPGADYTFDPLAGGWMKLHQPASWTDASSRCDSEGAVLASPVNSQIRNAIREYVTRQGKPGATVLTGTHANFAKGDYYSVEDVALTKMPVMVASGASVDYQSEESCVKWSTSKDEVAVVKCSEKSPFVCFKKRNSLVVAGCGTRDPEYKYDERSGSCYKFHRKGQTWTKAHSQCKQEGGYLTIINSALEHKVLLEVFARNPSNTLTVSSYASQEYAFIGIRDWMDGESWKSVDGKTLAATGYDVWAAGEPNNGHGNEHCGSINRQGNLVDVDCDYGFTFICEKNPEILYT